MLGSLAFLLGLLPGGPQDPFKDFALLWSKQSDRGQAASLDGATVAESVYVFAICPAEAVRVHFYLDDPNRAQAPSRTENGAPFDFRGGTDEQASPFDTSTLTDGAHTLTAELVRKDGTTALARAAFHVANGPPALQFEPAAIELALPFGGEKSLRLALAPSRGQVEEVAFSNLPAWIAIEPAEKEKPLSFTLKASAAGSPPGTHQATIQASAAGFAPAFLPVRMTIAEPLAIQIFCSSLSDRSASALLDGNVIRGDVFVFVLPEKDIRSVAFHLDDPRFEGKPVNTESRAPFDLMGGTETAAQPFDSLSLRDGPHSISARISLESGTKVELWAVFQVANQPPPDEGKLAGDSRRSQGR
jgi:hypothetical protein